MRSFGNNPCYTGLDGYVYLDIDNTLYNYYLTLVNDTKKQHNTLRSCTFDEICTIWLNETFEDILFTLGIEMPANDLQIILPESFDLDAIDYKKHMINIRTRYLTVYSSVFTFEASDNRCIEYSADLPVEYILNNKSNDK